MEGKWRVLVALLLPLLGLGSSGCVRPSVYGTRVTPVPVLVGPVKHMRAQQPVPQGPVVNSFRTEVENYFFVATSSERHGNVQVTTTVAGAKREGALKFDEAMLTAYQMCPQCTLRLQRLGVGAWYQYLLVAVAEKNWVTAFATVHAPAQ